MPRLPLAIRALNRAGTALNAVGLELPRIQEADLLKEASKQTGLSDFGDNPRGKHGTHRYTLDLFGLSPDELNERMASYADRFDLRS